MSKVLLLQHLPPSSCSPSIPWCGARVHHLGTLLVGIGGDAVRHLKNHSNYLSESAKKIWMILLFSTIREFLCASVYL